MINLTNRKSIKIINEYIYPSSNFNYDLWGIYNINSHNTCHYFLTIVDDYSCGTWVYSTKEKKSCTGLNKFSQHNKNML